MTIDHLLTLLTVTRRNLTQKVITKFYSFMCLALEIHTTSDVWKNRYEKV